MIGLLLLFRDKTKHQNASVSFMDHWSLFHGMSTFLRNVLLFQSLIFLSLEIMTMIINILTRDTN